MKNPMALRLPSDGNVLGVDYGQSRTGLALAGAVARLPSPLVTVNTDEAPDKIKQLVKSEDIRLITIGLPKSLEGNETEQSKQIRSFASKLKKAINTEIVFADETLSSVRAEQYLKDNKLAKQNMDSIAACFILEELFKETG